MTTISANNTIGLVLNTASYTDPIIIEPGVTISNSGGGYGGNAVFVSGAAHLFIIQNDGTISGSNPRAP